MEILMTIGNPQNLTEQQARSQCMAESSMLVWYPKIKDLDIPQPVTEIILVPYFKLIEMLDGNSLPKY